MRDDDPSLLGAHGVGQGVYGAVIPATIPGEYLIQARLEGWMQGSTANEAVPFVRTTSHIIEVSAATASLTGIAVLRPEDSQHAWIDLNVKLGASNPKFRAYAEVWGVDSVTQAPKPACWIGGVSDLSKQSIGDVVTLELDLRWLQRAGVRGPLTLKNVYISDMDTSFPVAKYDGDIAVSNSALSLEVTPEMANMEITKEMRFGVNPLPKRNITRSRANAPTLFLLPGYCASINPWKQNNQDFTEAQYFLEKGNFGHDEYALKVIGFTASHNPESFSLIGHSQGGFVALHISNFYNTELNNAEGGKLIQTVGTPWEGCSAAGDAAALGKLFGVGCGKNNDLTRDGAANWLTGISPESRKDVFSYTTTYKQGNFFGDYCNLPINLILQWPNDGTTELKYGTLKGGNYQGNTEKQCHISGMAYTAQTDDRNRNKAMNAAASR